MRNLITSLVFGLVLLGCGAQTPRGEQVPLLIDDREINDLSGGGILMNMVIDVVADPNTGTPDISTTEGPMTWPKGFTAWRVGSEVEVLDATGRQVLITGQRYMFHTGTYPGPWGISGVKLCPDCPLGWHLE